MKGKTRIELTNVNTGEKEIHEDENMFTNALQKIYNNNYLGYGVNSQVNLFTTLINDPSSAESLIGGVVCLDTKLDEDASIIKIPSGVNVTAHAGKAYTGNSGTRGTFNTSESEALDNGYKFVWDFETNQGNGTIKTIGLTTSYGGDCGKTDYGIADSSLINPYVSNSIKVPMYSSYNGGSVSVSFLNAGIDDDGYLWRVTISSTSKIILEKSSRPLPFTAPNLINYNMTLTNSGFWIDEYVEITLPTTLVSTNQNYSRFIVDGTDLYFVHYTNSSNNHYVFKLDYDNASATLINTITISDIFTSSLVDRLYKVTIVNGYLYYISSDYSIVKVSLTTGSVIKSTSFADIYTSGNSYAHLFGADYEGNVFGSFGNNPFLCFTYDEDANEVIPKGATSLVSGSILKWLSPYYAVSIYYTSNSSSYYSYGLFTAAEPLITINNLSSSVTKTSAQTMKITYTVTEASE